jgi:phosphoglycolate phosphatase
VNYARKKVDKQIMALVIFDYDGVLADTLEDLIRFGQEACNQLGVNHLVTKDDLSNLEVMSFATFGMACEVPENLIDDFVKISLNLFAEKKSPPAIFTGISDLVGYLSTHHKLAVVTTNTSQNVHSFLTQHGLDTFVHNVYGVDTYGSKAQKVVLARNHFMEEPVFLIGDALSDIRAAKEAGAISIAVTWGHQSLDTLLRGDPDYVVDSPHEIVSVIER